MLDPIGLITKNKAEGVLVAANLLILFLVGVLNRNRSATSSAQPHLQPVASTFLKRCSIFLSQLSALTDLNGAELSGIRRLMKALVETIEEHYDPARDLVSHSVFERLGLADAGTAAAKARGILILTADLNLHVALQNGGIEALNSQSRLPANLVGLKSSAFIEGDGPIRPNQGTYRNRVHHSR